MGDGETRVDTRFVRRSRESAAPVGGSTPVEVARAVVEKLLGRAGDIGRACRLSRKKVVTDSYVAREVGGGESARRRPGHAEEGLSVA